MAVAPGTVLGVPTGYTITAQVPAPPRLGQPYGLRPRGRGRNKSRGGKKRTVKHVSKRRTHRSRHSHRRKSHRRRTHRRR